MSFLLPPKNTSIFDNCSILITGGTGSFGQTMAKFLLKHTKCRRVIIFSRDEWKQWQMRRLDPVFDDERVRYFLGDVRDADRLKRAFNDVDYVIHAAALKQVPAAEYNPTEFIKTNIIGAMNVVDAAIDTNVKRVIALSTDKAVNPINLYGATKLCSDKLFLSASSYVGSKKEPLFSVVRYGNVLASRGSVLTRWDKLIQDKAPSIPLTDPDMSRFWITIDQAVCFVAHIFSIMEGDEIFIPKIPSMRLSDLAKAYAPDYPQSIIGIRDGEKLHETLISTDEAHRTFDHPSFFVCRSSGFSQKSAYKIKAVNKGFTYRSDTNDYWLSPEQIRQELQS